MAIRESPIIFGEESVRGILEGRKTQTRRVIKPQPPEGHDCWLEYRTGRPMAVYRSFPVRGSDRTRLCKCSFGQTGDHLWVRETWGKKEYRGYDPSGAFSMSQGEFGLVYRSGGEHGYGEPSDDRWSPSSNMPRWASRITLEITGIRIERLQDISHEDAIAEGCLGSNWVASSPYFIGPHTDDGELPVEEFERLWDHVNGKKYPWASNPWVFVIEFRRLSP